jgi:predicted  nucleic acid-binding Zn-ribbon protein
MMQIKAILLYNSAGVIRRLDFRLNAVNIITGKSKTGKSSIIDIISYCMGRSSFHVAAGIIQDTVAWYAVLYQIGELEVLVAKSRPIGGQASNSQVYFDIARNVRIPQLDELTPNSTDKAVIDELSKRIGISPNVHMPADGQSSEPLTATLRHTEYYVFQPQSVIASRDVLFYRQAEPQIAQHIKTTMNYFLGVVQEDRLRLMQELTDKKRDLRLAQRKLDETESTIVERANRGISLVREAQQVGLLSEDLQPQTFDEAVTQLQSLRGWQPTLVTYTNEDRLDTLQAELVSLRNRFTTARDRMHAAELYARSADGYSLEATEQASRLESIDLFVNEHSIDSCPLCGSHLDDPIVSVQAIRRSLEHLRTELDVVVREKPELDKFIADLQTEIDDLRREIEQKQLDIQALISEQQAAAEIRDTTARTARIIGRVSFFLDITPSLTDESLDLRREVERLQREVNDLEEQLDAENIRIRRDSVLNLIGNKMTELSKQLDVESGLYRLDYNRLTVVVDRGAKPIVMNVDMGSAANHLGSHLIALLGLQWYFITNNRPVPRFLVLDQPTQVYFPPDINQNVVDLAAGMEEDEDRAAVRKIFELLFQFVADYKLQVILLDHAYLDTPEFHEAIVDQIWRGDNALIPVSWITDTGE